jgi:RNA recognition motif. (a.k.a. RRM, RBD, or RNP domain)
VAARRGGERTTLPLFAVAFIAAKETRSKSLEMAKLYVGNLPWDTEEATLRALFGPTVLLRVELPKGRNGRSRGYALVELGSSAEAASAMQRLNGASIRRFLSTESEGAESPPPATPLAS